jgi:hypothetical protein
MPCIRCDEVIASTLLVYYYMLNFIYRLAIETH